jgi:signal transduction histidine kinase
MVKSIADDHAEAAASKGIELQLDIADNVGEILGDEQRLVQAIGHLADNAIRYGRADGRVIIAVVGGRKHVEIGISDDGTGMSNKDQASVFDGFGRSQQGLGSNKQGLGLPLARQLVESHGGTLTLESEPGQGTTVIVKLPR